MAPLRNILPRPASGPDLNLADPSSSSISARTVRDMASTNRPRTPLPAGPSSPSMFSRTARNLTSTRAAQDIASSGRPRTRPPAGPTNFLLPQSPTLDLMPAQFLQAPQLQPHAHSHQTINSIFGSAIPQRISPYTSPYSPDQQFASQIPRDRASRSIRSNTLSRPQAVAPAPDEPAENTKSQSIERVQPLPSLQTNDRVLRTSKRIEKAKTKGVAMSSLDKSAQLMADQSSTYIQSISSYPMENSVKKPEPMIGKAPVHAESLKPDTSPPAFPKLARYEVKFRDDVAELPDDKSEPHARVIDGEQNQHSRTVYHNITAMDAAVTIIYYHTHGFPTKNLAAFLNPDVESFTLTIRCDDKKIDSFNESLVAEEMEFISTNKVLQKVGLPTRRMPKGKGKVDGHSAFKIERQGNIVRIGYLTVEETEWAEMCEYVGDANLKTWTLNKFENFGWQEPHYPITHKAYELAKTLTMEKYWEERFYRIVTVEMAPIPTDGADDNDETESEHDVI